MSKPNTKHIIGFDVQQWSNLNVPAVVDITTTESYSVIGYVKEDYWI